MIDCHLFIDNFRGFSDTFIPITNVNFFVGQNSTGKTSVLGLLKLFVGPRFLFQQPFADDEVSFGHFSDMVSAHSSDRTFFRVGLVWQSPPIKDHQQIAQGWLATFVEEEGLPRLSKFSFGGSSDEISLRFGDNDVYHKSQTHDKEITAEYIVSTLMPKWAREHAREDDSYKKLSLPKGFPAQIPIMIIVSMINDVRDSNRKKTRTATGAELALTSPEMFLPQVTWIAPIRTKPRRTYDELNLAFSPEGGHTPYLIRRMLRSKPEAARFHAFMEKVGKASGLFQDVRTKRLGPGRTAPFEVDIVLDGKPLNLNTVGYGVSQALPVLAELLARGHGSWFAIQQPEVHLHPCAQAALGDVFFEMAMDHKVLIVETHSDFAIDRFRMNYRSAKSEKPDSQVLFFERRDKHNVVTPLRIGKNGELPSTQPEAYRNFFVKEEFRLLGI